MVALAWILLLGLPAEAVEVRLDDGFTLEPVDYQTRMVELCFPSGLRVAVQREARAPVVSITTVVDAGSTSDPPGKEGLSHLVEHLWFRSAGAEYQRGGEFNAFTGAEVTVYHHGVMLDELERALALEARRLEDPLRGLTQEDVELERRVVQSELDWCYGDTHRLALGRLHRKLFPADHLYHAAMADTPETVGTLSLQDAADFVQAHYLPERTTLVVVGDVSPEQV